MAEQRTYCNGRYRVRTVSTEMRMSHWVNAPVVEHASDGSTLLDLSKELWDLWEIGEEGDILVLVMRKYPGRTNGVEVRILPESDRYQLGGKVRTREELMAALRAFP